MLIHSLLHHWSALSVYWCMAQIVLWPRVEAVYFLLLNFEVFLVIFTPNPCPTSAFLLYTPLWTYSHVYPMLLYIWQYNMCTYTLLMSQSSRFQAQSFKFKTKALSSLLFFYYCREIHCYIVWEGSKAGVTGHMHLANLYFNCKETNRCSDLHIHWLIMVYTTVLL